MRINEVLSSHGIGGISKDEVIVGLEKIKSINYGYDSTIKGVRVINNDKVLIFNKSSEKYGIQDISTQTITYSDLNILQNEHYFNFQRNSIYYNKKIYYVTSNGMLLIFTNDLILEKSINIGSGSILFNPMNDNIYIVSIQNKTIKEWDGSNIITYSLDITYYVDNNNGFVYNGLLYLITYTDTNVKIIKYNYKTNTLVSVTNFKKDYIQNVYIFYMGKDKALIKYLYKMSSSDYSYSFEIIDLNNLNIQYSTKEIDTSALFPLKDRYKKYDILNIGLSGELRDFISKKFIKDDVILPIDLKLNSSELTSTGYNINLNDSILGAFNDGSSFQSFSDIYKFKKM